MGDSLDCTNSKSRRAFLTSVGSLVGITTLSQISRGDSVEPQYDNKSDFDITTIDGETRGIKAGISYPKYLDPDTGDSQLFGISWVSFTEDGRLMNPTNPEVKVNKLKLAPRDGQTQGYEINKVYLQTPDDYSEFAADYLEYAVKVAYSAGSSLVGVPALPLPMGLIQSGSDDPYDHDPSTWEHNPQESTNAAAEISINLSVNSPYDKAGSEYPMKYIVEGEAIKWEYTNGFGYFPSPEKRKPIKCEIPFTISYLDS